MFAGVDADGKGGNSIDSRRDRLTNGILGHRACQHRKLFFAPSGHRGWF